MKILIQQVHITDTQSPHNGTVTDILIDNGRITQIGDGISEKADTTVSGNGLHASPGWVDIFSHFCDPGFEYKETLETGSMAAAAGGFTDVFVIPNTQPPIDTKSQVEYIRQKSMALPVTVRPIGAITKNLAGSELAEMYDMQNSGAVAFSDGIIPVQSAGLLLKALQYVKAFNGVIIQIPDDKSVGANGLINEGIVSTRLGLPGKPMMAEELIIARDIKLARYAESKIHFTGVSSPKSMDYIRRAKDSGLAVTCSVTPYHLFFNDGDLLNYDTNLKVYPPLRTQDAIVQMKEYLLDGTIDCLASHHLPHEYDSKVLEFEYAKYGMTGLETAFGAIATAIPSISNERITELFSSRARTIFGLPHPVIRSGETCCITLFNPRAEWTVARSDLRSRSQNTPFLGKKLVGKVIGIINGEKVFLNN